MDILSTRTLMKALMALIVLYSSTMGQPPRIQYYCPTNCRCATLPGRGDAVQLVCRYRSLTNSSLVPIQTNHTVWLSVLCTASFFSRPRSEPQDNQFSHLNYLEELSIIACRLEDIPSRWFAGLTSLKRLSIGNVLQARDSASPLPFGVFDAVPNLEQLEVIGDNRWFHTGMFCNLHRLKYLKLGPNSLLDVWDAGFNCSSDETCSLCSSNVEEVNLGYNFLSQLPSGLGIAFPNLVTLNFSHNFMQNISDKGLENLQKLQTLDLSHNVLENLGQKQFAEMENLQYLNLSFNALTFVADTAFENCTLLKVVLLQGNRLTDVGSALGDLSSLLHLDISNNSLSTITNETFQHNVRLHTLNLDLNKLTTIPPGAFGNLNLLMNLGLSKNSLSTLGGQSLKGLFRLQELNLAENLIDKTHPSAFQDCQSVTALNFSNNFLTSIPSTLRHLSVLTILDMAKNSIREIKFDDLLGLNYLQGIKLKDNFIPEIPREFFYSARNLRVINMANNRISKIEMGAFDPLENLTYIKLENNEIKNIDFIFNRLSKLSVLNLENNRIQWLERDTFPLYLQQVHLRLNRISYIAPYTFSDLILLFNVDLRVNSIRVLEREALYVSPLTRQIPGFAHVPEIQLGGNILNCTCDMKWLDIMYRYYQSNPKFPKIPDMNDVYCRNAFPGEKGLKRYVELRGEDVVCQYQTYCSSIFCHCCEFTACDCRHVCPENCTCYQTHDTNINDVRCDNKGYTSVPHLGMMLTNLTLANNGITELKPMGFIGKRHLSSIDLANNSLVSIANQSFTGLFQLRTLNLSFNLLEDLKEYSFSGMTMLENLYLDHNLLTSIDPSTFASLSRLKILTLHSNRLEYLLLPDVFDVTSLVHLTLSHNRWPCDCDVIYDFKHWVVSYKAIIFDVGNINCTFKRINGSEYEIMKVNNTQYPVQRVVGKRAKYKGGVDDVMVVQNKVLYFDEDFYCNNITRNNSGSVRYIHKKEINTTHVAALVSVSILFFLTVIVTSLLLYYRTEIKVWIFVKFGCRPFYKPPDDDEKIFDAFISYSSKDEHLIVHELAPRLENGHPSYKLCLHYRDFPVGASIAETIIDAVEASKRTILVLSQNFLDSEWCLYEFQTAHHQALQDRTNRVIVILLEDIPLKNMDNELRAYMKTKTYLRWDDPWFWDKMAYALPDVHKDRVNNEIELPEKFLFNGYRGQSRV
ncbi:toll-like receptor Tollo [Lingula anatina]|uniref:Toll-like receptor Tollo n=1 Tax=Lingula anatina TaxID=7574 RepID=A0A1S3J7Q9_LINAN|nr:toll-like receptor Tollo [Lingula anatina]XP_013406436.1 toll-like receptor Tollo [Lingula anatina]XP_013406437.1 toll-like receptor Tollo [Lingula anatina]|eukprot:XP_013406435.1 toll-like receptor Tollo [Lingula anatina]